MVRRLLCGFAAKLGDVLAKPLHGFFDAHVATIVRRRQGRLDIWGSVAKTATDAGDRARLPLDPEPAQDRLSDAGRAAQARAGPGALVGRARDVPQAAGAQQGAGRRAVHPARRAAVRERRAAHGDVPQPRPQGRVGQDPPARRALRGLRAGLGHARAADRARDAQAPQARFPDRRPDRAAPGVPRARAALAGPSSASRCCAWAYSAASTTRT